MDTSVVVFANVMLVSQTFTIVPYKCSVVVYISDNPMDCVAFLMNVSIVVNPVPLYSSFAKKPIPSVAVISTMRGLETSLSVIKSCMMIPDQNVSL